MTDADRVRLAVHEGKRMLGPIEREQRAKVWAHRQSRDRVGYEVAGFPAKTHQSPAAQYLTIPAFVLQKFVAGADFDINVTVTLAEARAIRDQWSAAIVQAEGHEQCGADCKWCQAPGADSTEP